VGGGEKGKKRGSSTEGRLKMTSKNVQKHLVADKNKGQWGVELAAGERKDMGGRGLRVMGRKSMGE